MTSACREPQVCLQAHPGPFSRCLSSPHSPSLRRAHVGGRAAPFRDPSFQRAALLAYFISREKENQEHLFVLSWYTAKGGGLGNQHFGPPEQMISQSVVLQPDAMEETCQPGLLLRGLPPWTRINTSILRRGWGRGMGCAQRMKLFLKREGEMMSPSVCRWQSRSFMLALIILRSNPCPLSSPKTAALMNESNTSEMSKSTFPGPVRVCMD